VAVHLLSKASAYATENAMKTTTIFSIALLASLTVSFPVLGQDNYPPPDQAPAGGPPANTPLPAAALPSTPQKPSSYDRPISWKLLIPNLLSDQQQIWTFPAHVVQGQHWIPVTAFLGTTAGLVAADPPSAGWFRRTSTFSGFNSVFTGTATSVGMIVVPVSLYTIGKIRSDSKMERTALLAAEAVADSELVATVMKGATRRLRPEEIAPNGNFADSWFERKGWTGGSFPSGHSVAAFSIAAVVARRYGNHRWVPYVAYGSAALVGFSRVTLSAHFPSDVFVGAALGYSISRFSVLRQ
jgi:membrane-associated phospholipid phosphatase